MNIIELLCISINIKEEKDSGQDKVEINKSYFYSDFIEAKATSERSGYQLQIPVVATCY